MGNSKNKKAINPIFIKDLGLYFCVGGADIVMPLRAQGATLQSIANALNKTNEKTLIGGELKPVQVSRVISRLNDARHRTKA